MNDLTKVLVVDDGSRETVDPLAAELLELGLSSVTTSLDAADDVLMVIEKPSAIFLKMPEGRHSAEYGRFLALAERLRARNDVRGVPVIVWDRSSAFMAGGISAILRQQYGAEILTRAPS